MNFNKIERKCRLSMGSNRSLSFFLLDSIGDNQLIIGDDDHVL